MATVNLRYAHDHGVVRVSGDLGRGAVHELVRSVDVLGGEAYVALSDGRLERQSARAVRACARGDSGIWSRSVEGPLRGGGPVVTGRPGSSGPAGRGPGQADGVGHEPEVAIPQSRPPAC